MKHLYLILISVVLMSCAGASEPKIVDAEHHSLYFAGVQLADGYPGLVKALAAHGINPTGKPNEIDFSCIGESREIYQDFCFSSSSAELYDLLTYGLLPSDGVTGGIVTVCYRPDKSIKYVQISLKPETDYSDETAIAISKRLSEIFPYRKAEVPEGTTFYDDLGNSIFFKGISDLVVHIE